MVERVPYEDRLKRIAAILGENERFLILEHEKPDGDCIGSGLALALALSSLGKTVLLLSQDPHPPSYDFLPGRYLHFTTANVERQEIRPDVTVFVDCTDPERTGNALAYAGTGTWVNIDHHISNSMFGHVSLVDPDAAATGELIFFLLHAMDVTPNDDIATCLYVALVSDTGGFRYQNTSPRTLRVAARLIELGADPSKVAESLYENRSFSSMMLLKTALGTLALRKKGRIASIDITAQMMKDAGASDEDADFVIDYPRCIFGVEVALRFKEDMARKAVHLSLRSKSRVNVSKVAGLLGGGGHPRAAGVVLEGTLEEVKTRVFGVLDGLDIWTDF